MSGIVELGRADVFIRWLAVLMSVSWVATCHCVLVQSWQVPSILAHEIVAAIGSGALEAVVLDIHGCNREQQA